MHKARKGWGGLGEFALAAPFSCVKDKCHSLVPSFIFKKIKENNLGKRSRALYRYRLIFSNKQHLKRQQYVKLIGAWVDRHGVC